MANVLLLRNQNARARGGRPADQQERQRALETRSRSTCRRQDSSRRRRWPTMRVTAWPPRFRRWQSLRQQLIATARHFATWIPVGNRQAGGLAPYARAGRGRGSLARVRLTAFWERMRAQFGETYAESVAKDHVLAPLGGRTVSEALADGEDVKIVWRAVCEVFRVPERLR